ncbi:MAG: molecular chaperone DnaJ [Candidatus Omnitrophota bacterium]
MAHHPDRNPGDKKSEERFKEATEAYQVIADPQKRQVYDQYGHQGLASGGFSQGDFGSGFGDIFEDIFEDFFGGGGRSRGRRPAPGRDLQFDLEIGFEEAAFGAQKDFEIKREEVCSSCHGDGAKPGTSRKTCSVCHGQGQVLASSGFFSIARPCTKCHGQGSMVDQPCSACRGAGRVTVERKIQIRVPAGADTGLRLRLSGEGEAGDRGGPRGDLYIDLYVKAHDFFTREGTDLVCEVPIRFALAALGGEIEVPALSGMTTLKIPAGTQSGKVFRIRGKGLASLKNHDLGDLTVRVAVETPTHLSDKQKELLRQFDAQAPSAQPLCESFVEKVKKILTPKQ